ncbi:hypothetical protein Btru_046023 [Bulinus truncatus]|nr:hypothetical protein Btru_046023 [Bulinus truncatus]
MNIQRGSPPSNRVTPTAPPDPREIVCLQQMTNTGQTWSTNDNTEQYNTQLLSRNGQSYDDGRLRDDEDGPGGHGKLGYNLDIEHNPNLGHGREPGHSPSLAEDRSLEHDRNVPVNRNFEYHHNTESFQNPVHYQGNHGDNSNHNNGGGYVTENEHGGDIPSDQSFNSRESGLESQTNTTQTTEMSASSENLDQSDLDKMQNFQSLEVTFKDNKTGVEFDALGVPVSQPVNQSTAEDKVHSSGTSHTQNEKQVSMTSSDPTTEYQYPPPPPSYYYSVGQQQFQPYSSAGHPQIHTWPGGYTGGGTVTVKPGHGYPGLVQPEDKVPDYSCLSILVIIFCCWPLGVCALSRSRQAKNLSLLGQRYLAMEKASSAKHYIIAGIILGIICWVIGSVNMYFKLHG